MAGEPALEGRARAWLSALTAAADALAAGVDETGTAFRVLRAEAEATSWAARLGL